MAPALFRVSAALLVAALAACGGGGGGDGEPGVAAPDIVPATARVAGTIDLVDDSALDSDVNDPAVPRTANDEPGQQQPLRNPATLGGYANRPNAGPQGPSYEPGDEFDGYRVPLAAGQNVNLQVADPTGGDLDLFLLNDGLELVDSSEGAGEDETVTAPSDGEYTVLVQAIRGASSYVLQVGSETPAASHAFRYRYEFVPGEIMARFHDAARDAPDVAARAAAVDLVPLGGGPGRAMLFGLPLAGLPAALAVPPPENRWAPHLKPHDRKRATLRAAKALGARAEVLAAEPNLLRRASVDPSDVHYSLQWHYRLIHLPLAWDLTRGATSVLVAVVDTGVVLSHPDLADKFDPHDPNGVDFIRDAESARDGNGADHNADDPGDGLHAGESSFHGTHVAGTVAATTNNGSGVAGAAWNVRIMPLRVLGAGGGTSYDIQQAVRYAAGLTNDYGIAPSQRADVINLSLGGPGSSLLEQQVYAEVASAGVLIAAAAGNNGDKSLSYPASYPDVVSVAAVGPTKQRAYYSQYNTAVDVAAPGGDQSRSGRDGVLSTHATDSSGSVVPTYAYMQGTSMASPHVAAVMALMRSVHPALTQNDFMDLLKSGTITEDLGATGRDHSFGYGLIDGRRAVQAAIDLAGRTPRTTSPRLASSAETLEFGPSLRTLLFDLTNAGDDSLEVTSVTDDAPWLTVTPDAVAPDGTGRYRATVDRRGLALGLHEATITVRSSANTITISVTVQVAPRVEPAKAGHLYVLLLDAQTQAPVAQVSGPTENGRLAYAFERAPLGSYLLIAGSDLDNDGFICDTGESCGAYPTLDTLTPVVIEGDRDELDFLVGFRVRLNASGEDDRPRAQGGYPRLR